MDRYSYRYFIPTQINEDNQGVIHIVSQNRGENKLKNVGVWICFVQDIICKGLIQLKNIELKFQETDLFTNGLNVVQINKFVEVLGYI